MGGARQGGGGRGAPERWVEDEATQMALGGGDARTESDVEEGLRWRKTSEVDAWDELAALRCGRTR
jgi:hypothetical protein